MDKKIRVKVYVGLFLIYSGEIKESEVDDYRSRYSGGAYRIEFIGEVK